MAATEEQAALKEVIQMLKTTPDSPAPSAVSTLFNPASNDIPNRRERLPVLISTGKSKEAIGDQFTHEQVKRLTDKKVAKFYKRYEAYVGKKTAETLIDSFLMLVSKRVGMFVSIDDVKELQKDLKNDYIINQELASVAGSLSLRCGRWLAVANTPLITTKHIVFENSNTTREPDIVEHAKVETTMHPSRDSEGYPPEEIDEIDG